MRHEVEEHGISNDQTYFKEKTKGYKETRGNNPNKVKILDEWGEWVWVIPKLLLNIS